MSLQECLNKMLMGRWGLRLCSSKVVSASLFDTQRGVVASAVPALGWQPFGAPRYPSMHRLNGLGNLV